MSYILIVWRLFEAGSVSGLVLFWSLLSPDLCHVFFYFSLGLSSYTQKIADLLEAAAEEAPDVRSYLNIHSILRREYVFTLNTQLHVSLF